MWPYLRCTEDPEITFRNLNTAIHGDLGGNSSPSKGKGRQTAEVHKNNRAP